MSAPTTTQTPSYSVPEITMGDRIRRARLNAGMNQQDIEDETGIARNSVIAWEGDKRTPSPALLKVLADRLGVPAQWIIEGTSPTGGTTNTPTVACLTPTLRAASKRELLTRGGRAGRGPRSQSIGRAHPKR